MQEQDRAELIASLECVDYVTLFGEDTPVEIIRLIKPNIHVKGGDYKGKTLPEEAAVNENGGKVVIVPLVEGRSTTNVIDRIAELNGKEE
jgi:rfaE bifunctional protein nucleotidyltransferase chain/domain